MRRIRRFATNDYEERIAKFLEQDTCGKTVLHHAASQSQEQVEAILTSLETGCPEMLDLLRAKDTERRTVFHYASTNKDTAVLAHLLKSVECVENTSNYDELCEILNIQDNEGKKTVLHYASKLGLVHVQVVLESFKTGCPEKLKLLKHQDKHGPTAFHSAFENTEERNIHGEEEIDDKQQASMLSTTNPRKPCWRIC